MLLYSKKTREYREHEKQINNGEQKDKEKLSKTMCFRVTDTYVTWISHSLYYFIFSFFIFDKYANIINASISFLVVRNDYYKC